MPWICSTQSGDSNNMRDRQGDDGRIREEVNQWSKVVMGGVGKKG